MLAGALDAIVKLIQACTLHDIYKMGVFAADIDADLGRPGLHPAMLAFYLLLVLSAPALGYVFMAIDIRRYLHSLRRALVVIGHVAVRGTPYWALKERPPCLQALDLHLPCSEEAVLAAYRRRVKDLHPDRGGDLQQFLRLQKYFEQALALVRQHAQRPGTQVD